jgi:hypothetical protein
MAKTGYMLLEMLEVVGWSIDVQADEEEGVLVTAELGRPAAGGSRITILIRGDSVADVASALFVAARAVDGAPARSRV